MNYVILGLTTHMISALLYCCVELECCSIAKTVRLCQLIRPVGHDLNW